MTHSVCSHDMDKKIHKIEGLDTITIVYYPAAATSRLDRGRWARRHTRARDGDDDAGR